MQIRLPKRGTGQPAVNVQEIRGSFEKVLQKPYMRVWAILCR